MLIVDNGLTNKKVPMVVNLTGLKSTPLREFTLVTLETLSTTDNTSQAMTATFSGQTDKPQ